MGASLSLADDSQEAAATITPQSGHEFLQKNTTDYDNVFELNDPNQVTCGQDICNLSTHTCLRKVKKLSSAWSTYWTRVGNGLKEVWNQGGAILGTTVASAAAGSAVPGVGTVIAGGGGFLTSVTVAYTHGVFFSENRETVKNYQYKCVTKAQAATIMNKDKDWQDAGTNKGNYESTTETAKGDMTDSKTTSKCYTAKKGDGQYCITQIGDKITVVSGKDDKPKGCEVIEVSLYNNQRCRLCAALGPIFKTGDEMTATSHRAFARPFAIVLVMGLFLWLAIKTLAFVSSMTKQDAAKYITEFLQQSYKFAIAYFVLESYAEIFMYIIWPLMGAALTFATTILGQDLDLSGRDVFKDLNLAAGTTVDSFLVQVMSGNIAQDKLSLDYQQNYDNEYFTLGLYTKLENFAFAVNLQYSVLQTIGNGLMCLGEKYILGLIDNFHWGLGFNSIIYGIFFGVFGFLMSVALIFYMFDAVVQLGIVGALLPFLVASWPFKITSKYTSTGFKMFLNSLFNFMMIGLVAKIGVELIDNSIERSSSGETTDSGLVDMVQAINQVDTAALESMVSVFSIGFLLFLFANFMGFLMINKVTELTSLFSGSKAKPIAPSVATMGVSAVKGAVTKLAKPTTDAIEEKVHQKLHSFGNALGRGFIPPKGKGSSAGKSSKGTPTVGGGDEKSTPTVGSGSQGYNGDDVEKLS
jgi:hypothetical protein